MGSVVDLVAYRFNHPSSVRTRPMLLALQASTYMVLTPSRVFTTLALFNILRIPFAWLPMVFTQYINAKSACRSYIPRRSPALSAPPAPAPCAAPLAEAT